MMNDLLTRLEQPEPPPLDEAKLESGKVYLFDQRGHGFRVLKGPFAKLADARADWSEYDRDSKKHMVIGRVMDDEVWVLDMNGDKVSTFKTKIVEAASQTEESMVGTDVEDDLNDVRNTTFGALESLMVAHGKISKAGKKHPKLAPLARSYGLALQALRDVDNKIAEVL